MNLETHEYLVARQYAYLLLHRLFGAKPSAELAAAVDAQVASDALNRVLGEGWREGRPAAAALLESLPRLASDETALAGEYTRLFEGPAALPAPPWGSVYATGHRVIMDESTLRVRNAYRRNGFTPKLLHRVPDDHVALELAFLAALAGRAAEAAEAGDDEAVAHALRESAGFLDANLGAWAPSFAAELIEKGGSEFYANAAETLVAVIEEDRARLDGLTA